MSEFVENSQEVRMMEPEEIRANEDSILEGLFEAGDFKCDDLRKKVSISRPGRGVLFEFTVGPLTEEDSVRCRKRATKMLKNPAGAKFGKIEGETDVAMSRSLQIYYATVPEDRKKIWDNEKVIMHYGVINGYEVIDKVLMAGEKAAILEIIMDLSGFSLDPDDFVKK